MGNERNVIKWWHVTDYNTGQVTGLRGWDSRLEDRYELTPTQDPLIWHCHVVNVSVSGDEWWWSRIHEGDVLNCMVAAEAIADTRYADQAELEDEES